MCSSISEAPLEIHGNPIFFIVNEKGVLSHRLSWNENQKVVDTVQRAFQCAARNQTSPIEIIFERANGKPDNGVLLPFAVRGNPVVLYHPYSCRHNKWYQVVRMTTIMLLDSAEPYKGHFSVAGTTMCAEVGEFKRIRGVWRHVRTGGMEMFHGEEESVFVDEMNPSTGKMEATRVVCHLPGLPHGMSHVDVRQAAHAHLNGGLSKKLQLDANIILCGLEHVPTCWTDDDRRVK